MEIDEGGWDEVSFCYHIFLPPPSSSSLRHRLVVQESRREAKTNFKVQITDFLDSQISPTKKPPFRHHSSPFAPSPKKRDSLSLAQSESV